MKNNFIENYAIYSSGNEASKVYHRWSAISVMSSVVSRKVWIDFGTFVHYPNLYIILVGDPGNGKSTAMSQARKLLREMDDIQVAPPSITKEALTQMMGEDKGGCMKTFEYEDEPYEYSHLTMFANEIVTMLNTGGNAIGFIEFFTDIWDQPVFEYRTKGSGTDVINGPFVTLLGCMTPEQTGQMLKDNIISGGFSRRCLFVLTKNRGAPVPRPMTTPEQVEAKANCLEWMRMVHERVGVFTMTKETEDFYDQWYFKNAKVHDAQTSPVMKSYYRTKDCLLCKVAMLYALATDWDMAQGITPLVLTIEHFEACLVQFAEVEPNISKVFEGFGRNVLSDVSARVMNHIDAQGGRISQKSLGTFMWEHADGNELDQVMAHLCSSGKIMLEQTDGYVQERFWITPKRTPKTDNGGGFSLNLNIT